MSYPLVSAEEIRRIEREVVHDCGISELELMEAAGVAVADEILKSHPGEHVGIVAGKGNNAGDGFVVARKLVESGKRVSLILLSLPEKFSASGKENYDRLPESVVVCEKESVRDVGRIFEGATVVVDAIFGTGVTGAPRGVFGEAIAAINALEQPIVSIDLPSGLNADTGEAAGACVRADATVTMGLPKIGMIQGVGREMCGAIKVADIGFPRRLLESANCRARLLTPSDCRNLLPPRPMDGHKGTFGSLLVIAGGRIMSGAACLATEAALRSGCGLVYGAYPEKVADLLGGRLIEAIKIPLHGGSGNFLTHESWEQMEPYFERVTAIALGPGIGVDEQTARLVDEVVCQDIPMVIDADALNCLSEKVLYLTKRHAPTILTPHPGEMGRLLGLSTAEVQEDRIGAASRLAKDSETVVLLKGANTVIAGPGGEVFINPTGNSGLAKGGTGDVLTGLIGGLLAQGLGAMEAAVAGAYLHGHAGDLAKEKRGERGMKAGDILQELPHALKYFGEKMKIA